MASRTITLLAIAALASACAQLPTAGEPALSGSEAVIAERAAAAPVPPSTPPQPAAVATAAEAALLSKAADIPPADLWQRVRNGFRMNDLNNPLVREWEEWYSSRPDYVARMVERSSRYLYYIVEEVERRKMPAEIALLPMIESAYNPQAYSRSHASGIWQFIPSTGKHYGLRQNWWYDGRRDIIAATNAALDYLEKLYAQFGSWELALASYNWGEGAVSRAIAKNQAKGLPTDYESLNLPSETRAYVPKLQAVKNIIADPARFGLRLAEIPNEPYFATVATRVHIDVKLAARLAEMPLDEFKFLNPAHNRPVIKAEGVDTLVLPRHKVQTFLANLENHDKPLVSWQAYTVKAGEKPEKIADRYGISLARLKEINGINGRKKITTGLVLLVPVKGNSTPNLPDLPAPRVTLPKAIKAVHYAQRGAAARKVAQRQAARKKAVTSTRSPARRVTVTIRAPASGTKKVVVAQNQKDR
ncbi:MAG: transglycosylase SLT domain-containing protein [Burkholderiales bacterium]|nr:transglycosylase SLT domain-containing protein [Burkholderiales bacterium]